MLLASRTNHSDILSAWENVSLDN